MFRQDFFDRRNWFETNLRCCWHADDRTYDCDQEFSRQGEFQSKRLSPSHRIALLSDTHIAADRADNFRNFVPSQNLERSLKALQADNWSFGMICGDVARLEGWQGTTRVS